jgi:hypothetical protein
MDQQIKMSDVRAKFPMYADVPDDELLMALRRQFYSDLTPGEFYNRIDYDTERERLQKQQLADMSPFQRGAANVGAGMMDLVTGAKQLFTDLTGTPEQQAAARQGVAEKRALDQRLAAAAPGGELVGQGLQIAGRVAPTLAIPVGGALRATTALPRALGVVKAAPTVARMGTGALVADAALTGTALGAIDPVGPGEDRGINMVTAGALSAAAPTVMAGWNQARRMVTQAGGQSRAADQVAAELGQGGQAGPQVLRQTIERIKLAQQGRQTGPGGSIPLSTAATLGDPQLARLEAGSRARSGADWYDFDQQQARAVYDELTRATRGADDIGARRDLRSSNRQVLVNQAMATINEPAFARDLAAFRSNLDLATRTAEASNPAVRNMLTAVADEIDRLGPDFRPEHLATIRANLAAKAPALPTTAYQAAPRDSPATMSVLQEVDSILNNATGGRWSPVLQSYKRDSDIVRSSQAAGQVRESFIDPATGRVRGVSADAGGDVPKVTEAGLGRALDKARGPRRELVLDPTTNARLEAVLGALRAQNIVQGVKRSATAGGGSNTASDTIAAQAAGNVAEAALSSAGAPGRTALDWARGKANANKDAALAQALQNPQAMIQLLERQLAAGQPLTLAEQELLGLLRGLPTALQ